MIQLTAKRRLSAGCGVRHVLRLRVKSVALMLRARHFLRQKMEKACVLYDGMGWLCLASSRLGFIGSDSDRRGRQKRHGSCWAGMNMFQQAVGHKLLLPAVTLCFISGHSTSAHSPL